MARVSNTLIGKASGSVGNATFSTWKGINVLKEKAVSVANPNTVKQQAQRSAMAQSVVIARAIFAAIILGFRKMAVKQSQYNAFISEALKNAFDLSAPPTATFIPAELLISKGTISTTDIAGLSASEASHNVSLDYYRTFTGPGQSLADVALIAVFNITRNKWAVSTATGTRNTESANCSIPFDWSSGNQLRIYLGFYNELTGESSDSVNTNAQLGA